MTRLFLKLEEKKLTLSLSVEGRAIAEEQWTDHNNLLEVFFEKLEKVLCVSDMTLEQIDHYECDSDDKSGLTTERIAQTIMKTLAFGVRSS